VIEMRVRDEDVGGADELIGTTSDIERRVELANAKPGLVAGAGYSFDVEVRGVDGYDVHRKGEE
jgi:hypothetical protein